LVVGPAGELAVRWIHCDRFQAGQVTFPSSGPPLTEPGSCVARVRHRHRGVGVTRWWRQGENLSLELAETINGVAPGQALVLYRDDLVLGGGRILRTARERPEVDNGCR
jgi:tRNA-specific 2-thiouridylase